ncbi:hypothetical protein [Halorussus lipolyticus]|uniref:hypothetical protein n=1 Tax=Halorussus lipolyticus TaxID=3034024 RepID=UPI0023E7B6E1|nr:hypothetical protein [Halorussus sp. DT80]
MQQSDTDSLQEKPKTTIRSTVGLKLPFTIAVLSLIVVEPALAQQTTQDAVTSQSAVCSADNLPGMIEGFFQLTTGLGIVGLAVVWQADSLIEMFTLNPEQKKALKRHKRSAMKSTIVLVVLGPLYTVAGSMMGLPLAQCVDLVPW